MGAYTAPVTSTRAATALSYGHEVQELRAQPGAGGQVLAVLRNALYLESEGGHIVCVAGAGAEEGPLTLRVSDVGSVLDTSHARSGSPFLINGYGIEIGRSVQIEWGQADVWSPPLPACIGPRNARERVARELASFLMEPGGVCGYDPVIPSQILVESKLKARLGNLTRAIKHGCIEEARDAALVLLGFGPGLTPSGDDIVMGALAMLVWQVGLGTLPATLVESIAQAIREEAPMRTNRISVRLLHHASEGRLYAPAMELGAALLGGDDDTVKAPAGRLLAIGSSSGADLACGLVAGLWVCAPTLNIYRRRRRLIHYCRIKPKYAEVCRGSLPRHRWHQAQRRHSTYEPCLV